MILSYKHKFIFIKTMKTAGTAIQAALAPLCGPRDVVTPIDKRVCPAGYKHQNHRGFNSHMGAAQIKSVIPDDIWFDCYRFSVVRNPWDVVVSQYFYHRRIGREPMGRRDVPFNDWVSSGGIGFPDNYSKYTIDNWVQMHCLIRYEDIDRQFAQVVQELKLPSVQLPVVNRSRRERDYRLYYNEESKEVVRRYYAKEIELLGYEF